MAELYTEKDSVKSQRTLGQKVALVISVFLHPAFMMSYGIALLFLYTDFRYLYARQFDLFLYPVIIFSCLIPVTCLFFFKRSGYISDYALTKKEERRLPLMVTFISYFILFFYFYKGGLYTWFLSILLVPIILMVITGIVNIFYKISVHMLGIGSLIGTVLSVCYNIKGLNPYLLFMFLITLAGVLGVSRLVLKRHSSIQVYLGFVVGLVVSYLTVYIGGCLPF